MPGDAKECRQNALRCAGLAHTAKSPQLSMLLVNLSENWVKMADELERSQRLLEDYPPDLKKQT
jgi:hypothetical protein